MLRVFSGRRPARRWPSALARIGRFCARLTFVALALPTLVLLALRWLDPPTSAFILARQWEQLRGGRAAAVHHRWVNFDRISPHLAVAVIAAEDQRFPDHFGFDLAAINRALEHNARNRTVRGASTISQQTAKNLFLWSGRSYLRKGLEAGLTLGLEMLWPKRRILEVYLNLAEFGDGVFGARAAAERIFHTSPDRLSRQQAALLASVLPDPGGLDAGHPSVHVQQKARWVRTQIEQLGGARLLEHL